MNKTEPRAARTLLLTVYFIYFFCGMTLCFESVFLPEFKEYYDLSYQQQMYTMFAKNVPFLAAVAIGLLAQRIGLKNCLSLAMWLYALGTLLLVPALANGQDYWMVLLAFFVIGIAFNCQLVAGNPLLCELGPADGSSSRLNLGNALGAVAQIIAPATLTLIIPATVQSVAGKLPYMQGLFATIGVVLILIALFTTFTKSVNLSERQPSGGRSEQWPCRTKHLDRIPKCCWVSWPFFSCLGPRQGCLASTATILKNRRSAAFPHGSRRRCSPSILLFLHWAASQVRGFRSGFNRPSRLAFSLVMALLVLGVVVTAHGVLAIAAVTVLGFFVSIFFPTLYSLAVEGLGQRTAQASGLLTMGFLGCALLPVLQGKLADTWGLQQSYALCFVAYAFALFYALKGHRLGTAAANAP